MTRELHSWGMDNGARWGLPDVSGAPALSWKGENATGGNWFQLRPEYDVLRRPTKVWETVNWTPTNTPPAKCRALTIYGEELSNPADANYLGRMYAQFDSGGATYAQGYGLQGAPLGVKRTLALHTPGVADDMATLLDADPDYTNASQVSTSLGDLQQETLFQLEPDSAVNKTTYDALGRVVESVAPGFGTSPQAVHTYGYGPSGALSSIDVKDRTGTMTHHVLTHVEHNARGQRTRVERGNGVASNFTYDPHSFRVTRIYAKGEKELQDLLYTYDAAGNVLRIEDAAQQGVYFANEVVEPVQTFEVDALYRLTKATGREHAPAFGLDPSVLPKGLDGVPSQLSSDSALRTYTRRYEYDAAGNMRVLDVQDGWKRRMRVAGDSNRLTGVAHGRWPYGSWHWTPNPPPRTAPSWAPDDWEANPPATPYPLFGDNDPENWLALTSDQFGNMLQVPNVDVLKWDRAGNLRFSQSTAGSNRRVWYQYGSDNQRVRKVVEVRTNSAAEWRRERETLYLGGQEFYRTYDGSEALDYERDTVHVMDGDRREAMLEGDSDGVKIRYMLSDHLRSASVELDHDGELISYETFHPYGTTAYCSVSESSGVAAKRFRYSGKERDAETGLDYYGYRYLCSWLGRWVSADPAEAVDGWNLFGCVRGRPQSVPDADGRFMQQIMDSVTAAGADAGLMESSADVNMSTTPAVPVSPASEPTTSAGTDVGDVLLGARTHSRAPFRTELVTRYDQPEAIARAERSGLGMQGDMRVSAAQRATGTTGGAWIPTSPTPRAGLLPFLFASVPEGATEFQMGELVPGFGVITADPLTPSLVVDLGIARAGNADVVSSAALRPDVARLGETGAINPERVQHWTNVQDNSRPVRSEAGALLGTATPENETMVRSVSPNAVTGRPRTLSALRAGGNALNVFGHAMTVVELGAAAHESLEEDSLRPFLAEGVRQTFSWGGSFVGGLVGGAGSSPTVLGVPAGVLAGGATGGMAGAWVGDLIADRIHAN